MKICPKGGDPDISVDAVGDGDMDPGFDKDASRGCICCPGCKYEDIPSPIPKMCIPKFCLTPKDPVPDPTVDYVNDTVDDIGTYIREKAHETSMRSVRRDAADSPAARLAFSSVLPLPRPSTTTWPPRAVSRALARTVGATSTPTSRLTRRFPTMPSACARGHVAANTGCARCAQSGAAVHAQPATSACGLPRCHALRIRPGEEGEGACGTHHARSFTLSKPFPFHPSGYAGAVAELCAEVLLEVR